MLCDKLPWLVWLLMLLHYRKARIIGDVCCVNISPTAVRSCFGLESFCVVSQVARCVGVSLALSHRCSTAKLVHQHYQHHNRTNPDIYATRLTDVVTLDVQNDKIKMCVWACALWNIYNKHVNVCLKGRVAAAEGLRLTSGYFCLCEREMTGLACQAPCEHGPPELHTCSCSTFTQVRYLVLYVTMCKLLCIANG